jgi:hypothetical protein
MMELLRASDVTETPIDWHEWISNDPERRTEGRVTGGEVIEGALRKYCIPSGNPNDPRWSLEAAGG